MNLDKFTTVEQLASAVRTLLIEDMTVNKGWISSAWQKDPIRFGPSGIITEAINNTTLSAGSNTLASTAVPSGELHVITNLAVMYSGTVSGVTMTIQMNHDGSGYQIFYQNSITSGQYYDKQGWWVLDASDNIQLIINSATLNDDAYLRLIGFRIDIDQ